MLKNFKSIHAKTKSVPYTHMSKLFSLSPLEMGIMRTGIASIGDRTIKSLIEEFKSSDSTFDKETIPEDYTIIR